MKPHIFLRFILALLWSPLLDYAAPSFTIPLRFQPNNALLIDVHVNGHGRFVCTFDSGGSNSFVLDLEKARDAGLKPTESGTSAGVGPAVIDDKRLPGATLSLGSLKLQNQTVVMFPTGGETCIFGVGILRDFVVQIDYHAAMLRLYDPQSFEVPSTAAVVPISFSVGSPVVKARIHFSPDDAADANLLVDTAARRAVFLAKGFADRQQALRRVPKVIKPPFSAGGTGGAVDLLATRLSAISIGSARTNNPVALLLRTPSGASRREPDGYLGNEFLRRFLLTLDYPHARMFLQPTPQLQDPPDAYDGSGLGMDEKNGRHIITAIVPASAAAQAGIVVGDVLISLDGKSGNALTGAYIIEKLFRLDGRVVVQVERDGRTLTFNLQLHPVL